MEGEAVLTGGQRGREPSGFRRGGAALPCTVLSSWSPPQWPWAHFLALAPVSVDTRPPPPPVVFKSLGVSVYLLLGMRMGWVGAALGFRALPERAPHPPARLPPLRWCRFVSFLGGQPPPPRVGGPLKPIPASPDPSGGPGGLAVTDAAAPWGPGGIRPGRVGWAGAASGQSLCPLVGPRLCAWAQLLCQTDCPALLRVGHRPAASGAERPAGLSLPLQGAPSRVLPRGSSESSVLLSSGKIPPNVPSLSSFLQMFLQMSQGGPRDLRSPCLIDGA